MNTTEDFLSDEGKISALTSSDFFYGLDEALLKDVAAATEWIRLRAGETFIHQGDSGDCFFIVASGRLRAFFTGVNGQETAVGDIQRGETVGEMAVLTQEPRSASVRTVRDSYLAKVTQSSFEKLGEKWPALMKQMARLLAKRINAARTESSQAARTSNVVLVPAGQNAPIAQVAKGLVEALAKHGKVLHLNASIFDSIWGKGVANFSRDDPRLKEFRVISWFNQQEREHDFVILECTTQEDNWSSRCVGQADRLLLVGKAGANPKLSVVEAGLVNKKNLTTQAHQELIIAHPNGNQRPVNTAAWLNNRNLRRHHHVRLDTKSDFGRLARILCGDAIGLVLGGGGARGLAHIGVVRAFEELGIPIDCVGGTSAGAIMAGQIALGIPWQEMLEITRKGFIDMNPVKKDYTFPMISMMTGRRMNQVLQMMYRDTRIEDLWINYFCVSNNLTRAEIIVHTTGPLWRWVRASTAVPGVASPVIDDGDLLIDGGVLNNLPVDVMEQVCEGRVIAVDVSPRIEMKTDLPNCDYLSGWALLRKSLNPLAKTPSLPTLAKVMSRTAMLASVNNSEAMHYRAELYMHPPVDGIDMFAWEAIDDIAEIGYKCALEQVAAWYESVSPKPK